MQPTTHAKCIDRGLVRAGWFRIVLAGALAIKTAMVAQADESAARQQRSILTDVSTRGVFDPSVTEDPATGQLWMSYSSFDVSMHAKAGIGLRVASSDDGRQWHDAGAVQKFTDVLVGPLAPTETGERPVNAASRGTWQNEASTLVHDAGAPPHERWKLFWHQALWVGDVPRYASYSWIALKMADTPENLASAATIKLFTGYTTRVADAADAEQISAPIHGAPVHRLEKLDAQLGACVFGQPAALSTSDGLYLALDCAWLGTRPALHTVLLRCGRPTCNPVDPGSWSVVGRLTEPMDGPKLDERYKGFGATSFVVKDGRYYLLATPVTEDGDRYDGCVVFRFEDLARGTLERKRRNRLVVARTVQGIPETHHGACAAHAKLQGGILFSQIVATAAPRSMQIRVSGVELP